MADWTAPRVGDLRVDVLSPQGVKLGTIDGVIGGSLDAATARQIRTVGQLDVIGDRDDWLTIRLRPVFVMTSPVVGEFPLGVYLPATPRATHDGTGQATLSVDLYDRSQVLAGDGPLDTYTVAAGEFLIARVRAILAAHGEGPHVIEDSYATARSLMTWDAGTSWLRIVNDLLNAAGFFALAYDGEGTARAVPYTAVESRPVAWDFSDGEHAIRSSELAVDADYFDLYNRVRLTASSTGKEPELSAIAANLSDGPFSREQLGRWVTRSETVDAADLAALQAQADRLLDEATQLTVGVQVRHGWLPGLGLNDRVRAADSADGVDVTGTISRMVVPLDPTGLVTTNVGTVVEPGDWIASLRSPESPPISWAEVTSTSPLRIRRDGDTDPLPAEPGVLTDVSTGDRVAVYRNGAQLIIVGRAGGDPPPVPENHIRINGVDYQATGTMYLTIPAWTNSDPPVYSTTAYTATPYQPPPGYGFEAYLMGSSGYTYVSTSNPGAGTNNLGVRITQFHSANLLTITLGWRLTRLG